MIPIRVFIGHDERQPIASMVAAHSVWQNATKPVAITKLVLRQLPIVRRGLTEFTFSRFLVPYLSEYDGISIFMDADVLCRADVVELLTYPLAFPDVPVFVVKHERKFERPSVMVFNNELCKVLSREYVDDGESDPYSLTWTSKVGELPKEWNHLVGYDPPNPDAKLVHFTKGIPVWDETNECEYAEEWRLMYDHSRSTVDFVDLMGKSVHVVREPVTQ